jgi:hypothetical protein
MKAVDTGLFAVLSADAGTAMGTVTGSLNNLGATGVYRLYAPQTATLPFVLFNEQAGVDYWTFRDRERKSLVYQVKAVGAGHSGSAIAAMNDRFDVLLNDHPLTLTGWTCQRIRRESNIEYGEEGEGIIYQHVGGLFRIDVEPA